ncbi:hypothetical protein PGTUg99_023525 [Puccinia graminis f. sp. tritici]|uniref:Uncharacterized protein n=1 Tax=Puccinia graminis f. sp. tritici TaxID=56615 RepID=A0A5B0SCA9_PUCGR|nr:hypothetical protein PGTUg99_023525 [Puccinia graminis f. sp. tritici]
MTAAQKSIQDPTVTNGTENSGYATDQSQTRCRRSSRASSVVVAPNMVAPSPDSRIKLTRPASTTQKRPAVAEPESSSESESEADTQRESGSEDEPGETETAAPPRKSKPQKKKPRRKTTSSAAKKNKPAQASSKKKKKSQKETAAKKDEGFAKIEEFFYPPTWKEGDPKDVYLNFKCRWCKVVYRGNQNTNGNLVCHRDGFTQAGKNDRGCVNREKAKQAGMKLPLSVAERRQLENLSGNGQQSGISQFLQVQPLFANRVLNQLVMIWQIRQALPWSRIEDPYLRAAFQYTNRKAVLYGRRWSADESKRLYSMLKPQVFSELNVSFIPESYSESKLKFELNYPPES